MIAKKIILDKFNKEKLLFETEDSDVHSSTDSVIYEFIDEDTLSGDRQSD